MEKNTKTLIYISIILGVLVLISKKAFSSNTTTDENIPNGRKIIIGDSHAVILGSKVKNAKVESKLAHSGWRLSDLLIALSTYPVSNDVGMVFISIGTNGQYSKSDKIETLVSKLNQIFPNADLFIFKGSYGWSASGNEMAAKNQDPYYQRFEDAGVTLLNSGLGYFPTDAQAHSTTSDQAKAIINEINYYTIN
jgi:multimeric flavodoxin WrbA